MGTFVTNHVRDYAVVYVNGERHHVHGDEAVMMLSDYLRQKLFLTGTKIVCAEGDCGACTVLRRCPRPLSDKNYFEPINSCITTVLQMDGSSLVTVEGLGPTLTPVQKAMVENHGSQCGFCTGGIVCALTGLTEKRLSLRAYDGLTYKEAKNGLTGNLCRCTGYVQILEAAASINLKDCEPLTNLYFTKEIEDELNSVAKTEIKIQGTETTVLSPITFDPRFLDGNTQVIGAGTDLGVMVNKGRLFYKKLLSLHLIRELYEVKILPTESALKKMRVGARVTLSRLRRETKSLIPEFSKFLDLFASPQIKNVATLAGNVMNASPIGDTLPFLLISNATLCLIGPTGKRQIPITAFYLSYKKTELKPNEILQHIEFEIPGPDETLILKKISGRKDLDISSLSGAFRVHWADRSKLRINSFLIAMGGIAPYPIRLKGTEAIFENKTLSKDLIELVLKKFQEEISPISDLRGTKTFRRIVGRNLFIECLNSIGAPI